MRLLFLAFVAGSQGSYYSFSSSSSTESSYSNMDGKEHSASLSESEYKESDSNGLDRKGGGKLKEEDGRQVFESVENCAGGKCLSSVDRAVHPIRRHLRV